MNLQKAEVKIAVARDLVEQYAKMAKGAQDDQLRQEGARDALKLAAQRVGELGAHVDKDLAEGALSAADLKDPDKVQAFIKRFIKRAFGVVDNLATTAETARIVAHGRQNGLKHAEEVAAAMFKAEVAKIETLQRQIASGEINAENFRDGGFGGPGPTLKQQRQAEAAGAVEAPSPEAASSEPTSEAPVAAVSEVETIATTTPEEVGTSPEVSKAPRRPRKKPMPRAR